jgi:hypothetical protein
VIKLRNLLDLIFSYQMSFKETPQNSQNKGMPKILSYGGAKFRGTSLVLENHPRFSIIRASSEYWRTHAGLAVGLVFGTTPTVKYYSSELNESWYSELQYKTVVRK